MRAAIIGSTGGIGGALTKWLADREDVTEVFALSREGKRPAGHKIVASQIDITDEQTVRSAAQFASAQGPLSLVIVASGLLSNGQNLKPEKSYRQQSLLAFEHVFRVNTIVHR